MAHTGITIDSDRTLNKYIHGLFRPRKRGIRFSAFFWIRQRYMSQLHLAAEWLRRRWATLPRTSAPRLNTIYIIIRLIKWGTVLLRTVVARPKQNAILQRPASLMAGRGWPRRRFNGIFVLLSALLLAGCSSSIPVKVDSIVGSERLPGKSYRWFSGMKKVAPNDLYFREFSRYFRTALKQKGYRESGNEDADLAIYFSYGVSPGKTVRYTTSTPLYDWFGGDTIIYVETRNQGDGATSRTARTITTPAYRRMVGVDVNTRSYTLFTSFAILEAKRYRPDSPPEKMETLWKTTVSVTSKSNDLRALMPVLAAAALPYLGVDTGAAKIVKIGKDDPVLKRLERQSALQEESVK